MYNETNRTVTTYYRADEDYWDDYGCPELLITVDGWEEEVKSK